MLKIALEKRFQRPFLPRVHEFAQLPQQMLLAVTEFFPHLHHAR
jgi:hypothetical protein